jgi:hypothetical protein
MEHVSDALREEADHWVSGKISRSDDDDRRNRSFVQPKRRDKISAARRKGKWMGGYVMLGYDPDTR